MNHFSMYFPVLDRELARLQKILDKGLAPCYDDFQDFLCDWGPDFSWTPAATIIQLDELLASQEWLALAEQVKVAHGHDFKAAALAFLEESKKQ